MAVRGRTASKRKLWERQCNQHQSIEGERLWTLVRGHWLKGEPLTLADERKVFREAESQMKDTKFKVLKRGHREKREKVASFTSQR